MLIAYQQFSGCTVSRIALIFIPTILYSLDVGLE